MSQGASPISRLLQQIITDSGLRRSEFVQALGYKNATTGLRRLDEWLCGEGEVPPLEFCAPLPRGVRLEAQNGGRRHRSEYLPRSGRTVRRPCPPGQSPGWGWWRSLRAPRPWPCNPPMQTATGQRDRRNPTDAKLSQEHNATLSLRRAAWQPQPARRTR